MAPRSTSGMPKPLFDKGVVNNRTSLLLDVNLALRGIMHVNSVHLNLYINKIN